MLRKRLRLKIADREVKAEVCWQLSERWSLNVADIEVGAEGC